MWACARSVLEIASIRAYRPELESGGGVAVEGEGAGRRRQTALALQSRMVKLGASCVDRGGESTSVSFLWRKKERKKEVKHPLDCTNRSALDAQGPETLDMRPDESKTLYPGSY
eukprot:3941961-Rhodomonas_salina.17